MPEPIEFCFGDAVVLVPPSSHAGGEALVDDHGEPSSTAVRVWPCARALASALYESREELCQGCRLIELGAGLGLSGLAAWASGASQVLLTDLQENLPRLRDVVALNDIKEPAIDCAPLDWTQPLPDGIASTSWDVVIAADCVYWPHLYEPLLAILAALSSCGGDNSTQSRTGRPCRILLCTLDRQGRTQEFEKVARQKGFGIIERPLPSRVVHLPCEPTSWAPTHAPAPPGARLMELVPPGGRNSYK